MNKKVKLTTEQSVLRDKIRTEMNDLADVMAGGGCTTWEHYQKLAGVIEGLARAERHIFDLAEKTQDDDE